jgi:hypothetical protein
LPEMFAYPGIFAPVDVTTNCAVALPAVNTDTFAFDVIVTLEVPFCTNPVLAAVVKIPVAVP